MVESVGIVIAEEAECMLILGGDIVDEGDD